jgi:hypothetical protein
MLSFDKIMPVSVKLPSEFQYIYQNILKNNLGGTINYCDWNCLGGDWHKNPFDSPMLMIKLVMGQMSEER